MFVDTTMTHDLVALLFWKDPSGRNVMLEATDRPPCRPSSAIAVLGDEALRWVFRHNRPLVLDNGVGILGRMQATLDKAGLRSAAILPLTNKECPVGAIVLGCRTGPAPFVFMEPSSLSVLGQLLSNAFERLCLLDWRRSNEQADPHGKA